MASDKISPRRAIRQHCIDCCLGDMREVKACQAKMCLLYQYRSGHRAPAQTLTPLKAIRAYCLACGEPDSYASVRDCKMEHCKLHQFRFGHNPRLAGKGNRNLKMPKTANKPQPTVGVDDVDSEKGIQVCLS